MYIFLHFSAKQSARYNGEGRLRYAPTCLILANRPWRVCALQGHLHFSQCPSAVFPTIDVESSKATQLHPPACVLSDRRRIFSQSSLGPQTTVLRRRIPF